MATDCLFILRAAVGAGTCAAAPEQPESCSVYCHSYRCGNGVTEGVEACDDGNNANGDGCNEICLAE